MKNFPTAVTAYTIHTTRGLGTASLDEDVCNAITPDCVAAAARADAEPGPRHAIGWRRRRLRGGALDDAAKRGETGVGWHLEVENFAEMSVVVGGFGLTRSIR